MLRAIFLLLHLDAAGDPELQVLLAVAQLPVQLDRIDLHVGELVVQEQRGDVRLEVLLPVELDEVVERDLDELLHVAVRGHRSSAFTVLRPAVRARLTALFVISRTAVESSSMKSCPVRKSAPAASRTT